MADAATATKLVDAGARPIHDHERALGRTVDAFERQLSANGSAPQWTKGRDGASAPPAGVSRPPGPDERGWAGRGGAYLDGDKIVSRPRNPAVPEVMIPNNTGAQGFEVGPAYRMWEWEHTYHVPYSTGIPFDTGAGLVGDAIARNPRTDVRRPADQRHRIPQRRTRRRSREDLPVASPDPSKYTDMVVNYTIAGEHRLHEGCVIRYGERDAAGNVRLVTYGMGNSPFQHPVNVGNSDGVQRAWGLNHLGIADDVRQRLRARQPAR